MAVPTDFPFERYLAAKRGVDDRALNGHVWEQLRAAVAPGRPGAPLRVLEVGAGIGTMIERLVERGLLAHADYTAIDWLPANVAVLGERLPAWARAHGWSAASLAEMDAVRGAAATGGCTVVIPGGPLTVRAAAIDLFDFAAADDAPPYDLLVAHAVLDLVDARAALAALLPRLRRGGLAWLTVVFDGITVLEPRVDPELDELLPALYAESIDAPQHEDKPPGDRHAGRHIFGHLRALGAQMVAAGSSDWVVHPRDGGYPGDEAYFLHWLIHQFDLALRGHPRVSAALLQDWIARRQAQIAAGELVYIAHQLDYLARW